MGCKWTCQCYAPVVLSVAVVKTNILDRINDRILFKLAYVIKFIMVTENEMFLLPIMDSLALTYKFNKRRYYVTSQ